MPLRPFWNGALTFVVVLLAGIVLLYRSLSIPLCVPSVLAAALLLGGGLGCFSMGWLVTPIRRYLPFILILCVTADLGLELLTDWSALVRFSVCAVVGGLAYALKQADNLRVAFAAGSAAIVLSALFSPVERVERAAGGAHWPPRPDLPPTLHLLLDSHPSIEAIAALGEGGPRAARDLEDYLLEAGFQVYRRPVAPHPDTRRSLAASFNFHPATEDESDEALATALLESTGHDTERLKENRFVDAVLAAGYRLDWDQTVYVQVLPGSVPAGQVPGEVRSWRHIPGLAAALRRDPRLEQVSALVWHVVKRLAGLGALLPSPNLPSYRDSANRALHAEARLRDVARGPHPFLESGTHHFVHILFPHTPYLFDANCVQQPHPSGPVAGLHPAALAQTRCSIAHMKTLLERLRKSPRWAESFVMLHGDHGLRLPPPLDETGEPLMDESRWRRSMLMAIKLPGEPSMTIDAITPLAEGLERLATALGSAGTAQR